jgi:ABC-type Fe3+/spermidine/putrescine transport system ATPase subunit
VFAANAGRIAQEGTPRQIYEEPCSAFVMDFWARSITSRPGGPAGGRRLRRAG